MNFNLLKDSFVEDHVPSHHIIDSSLDYYSINFINGLN